MKDSVRVLFDTRQSNWKDNPYIDLLAGAVSPEADVIGFSWRTLLLGRYDVLHVHWPEHFISQPTFARRAVARSLFVLALLRIKLSRVPVIRTMHNKKAHFDVARTDQLLLGIFERTVSARIWLAERQDEDGLRGGSDVVIPHSDYAPWLVSIGADQRDADGTNQVLCFGVIRRYKRFEEAANAAVELGYPHVTIAGAPSEPDYAAELGQIADAHPQQLSFFPGRLDSDELVERIQATNLVAVPYADLYNSGVILMALSLQRPVALRDSPASRDLAAEYGDFWIRRYEGTLTAASLDSLLRASEQSHSPAFSERRQWSFAGQEHKNLYQRVVERN